MKVIIMCGGIGSRMYDYSLPKPLNMIYGKPAIHYVLKNFPETITELYFIYGKHLKKYNFEEIIINQFKTKQCYFTCIDYLTRGPVESVYLGVLQLNLNPTECVVFLDNDNMYVFPEGFFKDKEYSFLGTTLDTSESIQYSFVESNSDNFILNIVEKKRISNTYCCGVYGFRTIGQFIEVARELLNKEYVPNQKKELYMSELYRILLEKNEKIKGINFKDQGNHIGSLGELENTYSKIKKEKLRICFDLDNTLVTFPRVPGDYNTVNAIEDMIQIARRLHEDGHTIIIYTARRMETHKYNQGAALKDIGKITFDTLDKFKIPYDEIIFGKPNADIYIDDRAINPYINDISYMGILNCSNEEAILNKLPNNKLNTIRLYKGRLIKEGPTEFIRGEQHVYRQINNYKEIKNIFPEFYGYNEKDSVGKLEIEYIKGIPLYHLHKNNLITEQIVLEILNILNRLHNCEGAIEITKANLQNNYIRKLKKRFEKKEDYPFEDREEIQQKILRIMDEYVNSERICTVPFIHGDLWFSNILLTYDNSLKCFDMKGIIDTVYTTNGDPLYDYAKLYQSFLGYDLVLWDGILKKSKNQIVIQEFFEKQVEARGIRLSDLKAVTFGLISGTFFAIPTEKKDQVWRFLKGFLE